MTAVLASVLNILVLAVLDTVVLRAHGANVLVRVLSGEESVLGLPLPVIINHSAQLRRRALTLRKVVQVLQHRFLSTVVELILHSLIAILSRSIVMDLLLSGQCLLELQLLLHLLLLVREDRVLARGATAAGALRIVDRV